MILSDLHAERSLPLRRRDRTLRAIDRDICRETANAIAEHLQDVRDKAETHNPHTAGRAE